MYVSEIIEDEDDVENENNGFIIGFTKCARSKSSCVTSMIQYHALAWTTYTSEYMKVFYLNSWRYIMFCRKGLLHLIFVIRSEIS